jgi:recombinational DNA repair protein (RecF pathway)
LFYGFLRALPKQPPRPRTIFAFELKLLGALGLAPDVEESKFSAETRALVNALTHTDWERLPDLRATAAQARAVRQFLHGFLIFHLGKIPRGRGNAVEN